MIPKTIRLFESNGNYYFIMIILVLEKYMNALQISQKNISQLLQPFLFWLNIYISISIINCIKEANYQKILK